MRETTIFRFSRAAALLLALAAGGVAHAQERLQVPTSDTLHVVARGETLWELAERYLGDPLLWPEIYRLNTLVVEDPHWIFPGEELMLVMGEGMTRVVRQPGGVENPQAAPGDTLGDPFEWVTRQPGGEEPGFDVPPAPVAPPPPPATESAPSIFARSARAVPSGPSIRLGEEALRYRAIRPGEFYAAGFLTEGQSLPWAEVLGSTARPALRSLSGSSTALIFGEIRVRAPGGATYAVGDSLLVVSLTADVGRGWGRVVIPSGIARVRHVDDRDVLADVVQQFDRIADGQFAMPLEPFRDPGRVVPVPVENGMIGEVVVTRDRNIVPGQQDIMFIDRGRNDGVALGDLFVALRPSALARAPLDTLAYLQIVHVRERSASAMLTYINDAGVGPGVTVQLFRKMPS